MSNEVEGGGGGEEETTFHILHTESLIETNFNGTKWIHRMVVKKIGYREIDLDLIERAKSQARQEKVNVGIEELALSIKVSGTDGACASCAN